MSPSGAAAAIQPQQVMPNGVARPLPSDGDDDEFRRVLANGGFGGASTSVGDFLLTSGAGEQQPTEGHPATNSSDDRQQVGRTGSAEGNSTMTTVVLEQVPDRPLLPHAAVEPNSTAGNVAQWWPSPFPSPLSTTSRGGDVTGQAQHGRNFAQSGAAAVRWFSRLGEYMRQATMVSQSRPGIEATVVSETVWSPGGSRRQPAEAETPLFDTAQSRRLQDMARQAPQLYGPRPQAGAASDTSGSYTKEQLEAEVRRQVELALTSHKGMAEENQRLRLQVERLSAEVTSGREVGAQASSIVSARQGLVQRGESGERLRASMLERGGVPEGNPPGLSGHGREHGGLPRDQAYDNLPGGNPRGLSGHGSWQGGEGPSNSGVPEGNPRGLSGHGREHGGSFAEALRLQSLQANVMTNEGDVVNYGVSGDNVPGGNPPGLSGHDHVPRGRLLQDNIFPGGNPPGLSGHGREHGGPFNNNFQHAPSTSGVVFDQHAPSTSGGPTFNPLGVRRASSSPPPAARPRGEPVGEPSQEAEAPNATPLDALLKGMSQLQAAMALQMGMAASKPEVIRPGVSGAELPKLQEADEQAAINVGDWLHGLAGPMGDMTDGSAKWWSSVMAALDRFYQDYMSAPTVRKVQLRAEDYMTAEMRDVRWLRLDKRAASMLLQAVPETLKSELMANRLSTTLGILGRILVIYRPGSAAERQQVLRALENPGSPSTASDLVEALRRWMRWLKRAQDLGLQVPDASILLKGLDSAAKQQLEKNPEVVFRSNMMRFSLDLDSAPNVENVLRYHGHLLAEFEQLSFRGRGKASGAALPAVRNVATNNDVGTAGTPKNATSPLSTTTAKPCKFYLSETGCQRSACKFLHDWQSVPREDRANKCKGCGGKGHMKKDCPMKGGGEVQPRGEGGKGTANPKIKNVKPDKREESALPVNDTSGSTTSPATATAGSSSSGPATSTTTIPPTTTTSNEDFLKSATQILKLMAEQTAAAAPSPMPSMKMLKKAVSEMEARMALVDSGATHPLRRAEVPEWEQSPEVDVVVAGDSVAKMRQNETGTLLTSPTAVGSQTILPVGSLVKVLGYELVWTKRRCMLRGPEGREISLKVSSGCPEISEATALELIAKIEEEKLNQLKERSEVTRLAMLKAKNIAQVEQWELCMKEYVTGGKFEDGFRAIVSMPWLCNVPREELVKLIMDVPTTEASAWELMKSLGYNRRMRKRLMHKDWAVRFYSGKRNQMDKIVRPLDSNNSVVLDIDELRNSQWDVLKEGSGIYELMLWGASTGRIGGVMAGIPKVKSHEHLLRMMTLIEVAKQGRQEMCKGVDIPTDGVAVALWASSEVEEDLSAQAFQKEWFKKWVVESMMNKLHFEQGALGHPLRRPTVMVSNMDITELRGLQDGRSEEATWGIRSTWAPMMMHILVRGWKRWKLRPGWYPRMVKELKAVDRKAWERHLANDHVPHRPDCLQCIHNSTGRPHRRCLHKDCYVMSADTLGPVRVAGPKGEKYALVFTYQYPKQKMGTEDEPIVEEDLVGWDLDAAVTKEKGDEDCVVEEENEEEIFPSDNEEAEVPQEEEESVGLRAAKVKEAEPPEDWWEFREAAGVLIRHHEVPRKSLFRPTASTACPLHPAKLEETRITEVKYVGGGVETETSDWHGPKSGARSLDRPWVGTTRFRISAAEVPEDEQVLQRDEDQWEKLIGDLTKPVEMETIYLVYPVRSKRGGDAMLAIQEAVLRLKLMGLPVARLHTDRGSEFSSRGLHRWLLDHDIYHTRSEALVPQTNGAAERGVRWFKTRAKVLLAEADIPVKYWTLAMQHAANRRVHERLGITKPLLLPFGCKVMIRRKVFGNNKKYDLTDRWEQG